MRTARANDPSPSRAILAGALIVSIAVHAAGAFAVLSRDRQDPTPVVVEPDESPEPRDEAPIGIAESDAMTLDWLGFADPTPHEADLAESAQAALSPNPSDARSPVPTEAAPAPSPAIDTSTTEPTPEPTPTPAPIDAPLKEATAGDEARVRTGPETPPTPEDAPAEPKRAERPTPTPPTDAQPSPLRPETPAAGEAPQTANAGEPAIKDERESPATAREPFDARLNGRPIAREGLQIRTVNPEFSITTRLTSAPRNPIVDISFGPDGRAKRVEFTRDPKTKQLLDAGDRAYSEPVLNALYRWRASGPRIEALKGRPAEGGANLETITVRIVLRR